MRKVAIVGAGAMAREHARAFADLEGVEVAGIHGRTRARAEALARELSIGVVADSIDELQERTAADLAVGTVSEGAMREVGIECVRRPWAVLLEKPPGLDLGEAGSIREAAVAAGNARVFVALNRRFLSSTRAALQDLRDRPGSRFIHVIDQEDLAQSRALGFPEPVVRRWMYANSIHVVDYLRIFGRGDVVEVEVVEPWRSVEPDVVVASVLFSSGDRGLYQAYWGQPGPWAVSVTTPDVRWELRPLEDAGFQLRGSRGLAAVPRSEADLRLKPGFRLQASEALEALSGRPSLLPTLDEALSTMELIRSIYGV